MPDISEKLDSDTFESLVDIMLEQGGTPRRHLFEYPHRADDSRDYIAKAEKKVRLMLEILAK